MNVERVEQAQGAGIAWGPRSIALFVILYQFRLIAGDLADTPVYTAALLCAFIAAWALSRLKAAVAVPSLLILPWAIRFAVALPRLFVSGVSEDAAALDGLLLGLDRNGFVFLLPCCWASLTSYFSLRSRRFLRGDIIAADALLAALFCVIRSADLEAYRWPVLMIALFAAVVFLQLLALMLSLPPEIALRCGEGAAGALALLALVILGGVLLLRPSQEGAVDRGGGLLQPKLFQFDFSQILRLESEISMDEDLVLILRKDPEDSHILTRRFVLSGYNSKQGFYRHETIDEQSHPQRLPNKSVRLSGGETGESVWALQNRRLTGQEYFLVNFDASAFIGMNEPEEITPFESWDASSFSSAYAVKSYTSEALPFELIDSVKGPPSAAVLGLSEEDYAYYTEYGGDRRLASLAQEISAGIGSYWDKVQAIYEYLKYGDYRYSLKPGIAPDGDQLGFFLFTAKKGYCSYFAFAMTLLLRSQGIPARVAVGFFMDPNSAVFNYYPVQSNMAHAWVEVYYPGYGWIEYDPTTTELAVDEEFTFSSGVPQDLFERLMKEILDNRSRLTPKEGKDEEDGASALARLGADAGRFIRRYSFLLAAILLCGAFLHIRCGLLLAAACTGKPRKKAVRLWAQVRRRLSLAGLRRNRSGAALTEAEWAGELSQRCGLPVYALYQEAAAARYAPSYSTEQFQAMREQYRLFSAKYGEIIPPQRRLLAWLLPPLALLLGPARRIGFNKTILFLLIALFLFVRDSTPAGTQEAGTGVGADADALYEDAQRSLLAEFWERAIELYAEGEKRYPEDSRFPMSLGALYYSRQLYGLAWEEYRKAEALLPDNPALLYRMSRTVGYLNRDAVSAEYLERLLAIEPDNRDAIGSLGWMYYKLHRLNEGEDLLLSAMDRFGIDADYSMNLGTIYSDMFRYDDAKNWYLEAIAIGEDVGDRQFTAVAHYNLALLESRFYKYAESFDRTNASLSAQNRASGRLARGELFLRRLEFQRVFGEYQTAYETDTSPLSKVNLAQAYQAAGRLEEARLYAEDCLRSQDLSWMINYGIDTDRYKRDIHDILRETYRGLANAEGRAVYGGFKEWAGGVTRRLYYTLKAGVHDLLFRKYSLIAADAYSTAPSAGEGQRLDALLQYYNAFEHYPRRAIRYLEAAGDFEIPLIPKAASTYGLEGAILLGDAARIREAVAELDPLWERDQIAEAYTELALRGGKAERRDAAERLYALNRGALRQRGIVLPVELVIDADVPTGKVLRRVLKKMGFEEAAGGRFRLSLTAAAGGAVHCELYDNGKGTAVFRRSIDLESPGAADLAAFAKALGDEAFVGE